MWRLDLQRALNITEPSTAAYQESMNRIQQDILTCIVGTRHKSQQDGVEESQCHQLVSEAATLANNIRLSLSLYSFEPESGPIKDAADQVLRLDNIKYFRIVDSRTGSALSSSAAPIADGHGRVGKVVCVVFPGFRRKSTAAGETIALAKPTIVVKFDHPVPRSGKVKA